MIDHINMFLYFKNHEMHDNKFFDLIKWYLERDDFSRNNANLIYSLPTLNNILSWAISKDFWFDQVYKDYKWKSARDLYNEGWLYFHNMSILWPYCSGFSAKDLATLWLNSNASNDIFTRPPKYYRSLLDHCANFIAVISQEIHWACAINDLTAIVWSYLRHHKEVRNKDVDKHDLLNAYESFIYAVNTPFRAWNSPFTNITMNFEWDPHLRDEYVVIWWDVMNIKYKDIPTEYLNMSNEAFIKAMAIWDWKWKPFTFPLITINIYNDFDWNNETFNLLLEKMDKWWGCYFENYQTKPFEDDNYKKLNKYIEPRDSKSQRSFCCRFRVNFEDILKAWWWSNFRSNAWVWWVWVFNINLNRLAYISMQDWKWNKEMFYEYLDFMLEACEHFAQQRRNFIESNKELYPYFFYYNKSLASYFNVLSVIWWHEAIINIWFEKWLNSKEWRMIAHEIAEFIVQKIDSMMKRDQVPISLEFAPSENWAPTLARKDLAFVESLKNWTFESIFEDDRITYNWELFVQWNDKWVFLTSWFQPPYDEKNLWLQVEISAQFQSYATWWSVQHVFLWEQIPIELKKKLVWSIFEKPVMYTTLTPTITTCHDCDSQIVWEHLICPHCWSANILIASRVIWYLRPIAWKNLTNDWRLDWEENYWQDWRRVDRSKRKKVDHTDIEKLLID